MHGETQSACEDGVQAARDALGVVRQLLRQPLAVRDWLSGWVTSLMHLLRRLLAVAHASALQPP